MIRDLVGEVRDQSLFDSSLVGTSENLRVRPSDILSTNNRINVGGKTKELAPKTIPPKNQ